jgi:hypothetical protein
MNDIAIRVENLSKKFQINISPEYQTLVIHQKTVKAPMQSCKRGNGDDSDLPQDNWALQDVSFEKCTVLGYRPQRCGKAPC